MLSQMVEEEGKCVQDMRDRVVERMLDMSLYHVQYSTLKKSSVVTTFEIDGICLSLGIGRNAEGNKLLL